MGWVSFSEASSNSDSLWFYIITSTHASLSILLVFSLYLVSCKHHGILLRQVWVLLSQRQKKKKKAQGTYAQEHTQIGHNWARACTLGSTQRKVEGSRARLGWKAQETSSRVHLACLSRNCSTEVDKGTLKRSDLMTKVKSQNIMNSMIIIVKLFLLKRTSHNCREKSGRLTELWRVISSKRGCGGVALRSRAGKERWSEKDMTWIFFFKYSCSVCFCYFSFYKQQQQKSGQNFLSTRSKSKLSIRGTSLVVQSGGVGLIHGWGTRPWMLHGVTKKINK